MANDTTDCDNSGEPNPENCKRTPRLAYKPAGIFWGYTTQKRTVLYILGTGCSTPLLYVKPFELIMLTNAPLQLWSANALQPSGHIVNLMNFARTELIVAADSRVRYQEVRRTPQIARESPLDSWGHPYFL